MSNLPYDTKRSMKVIEQWYKVFRKKYPGETNIDLEAIKIFIKVIKEEIIKKDTP